MLMVNYILEILVTVILIRILGKKIKLPLPILLVTAGIFISYIPGMPEVHIVPEIVLLIFLPPLLFADAWMIPKREFLLYKRPISLLAIGLVIATTLIIGYITHYLIPSIPLSMGFVLGAIVSPTDAVAVSSIIEHLKIPKSISIILRGESLINDASALVAFKLALVAALTGYFSTLDAIGDFAIASLGAGLVGLILAYCFEYVVLSLKNHQINDHYIEVSISLLTPFIAYLLAESFHFSGIIAVVIAGLYSGWKDLKDLSYSTREHLKILWKTLVFFLNGMMFVLLGLQLPFILESIPNNLVGELLGCSIFIFTIMIVTRMLWVFCGAYTQIVISRTIGKRYREFKPSHVFIVGWGGIRGTITVVAAFSIPLTAHLDSRNIVVFIAFVITMCSLLVQGLSILYIINKLGVNKMVSESNTPKVWINLANAAIKKINEVYVGERVAQNVINYYQRFIDHFSHTNNIFDKEDYKLENELRRISLEAEKEELLRLYQNKDIDEELFKKIRDELDLKLRTYEAAI